jgi:hypothetical protein
MTRVAVSQSNYIPWIGYFEMISSVSDFVFLDNVQYTNRDWRNRNQIKTPQGKLWLSLDIETRNRNALIQDVMIVGNNVRSQHLESIRRNYRRSKYFSEIYPQIEQLYEDFQGNSLSDFNQHLIKSFSRKLGIETRFHNARDFPQETDPSKRILAICKRLQAITYVSGPAAKDYLDIGIFKLNDVKVEWFKYATEPYEQLWEDFDPHVSILDPVLNNGWNILRERGKH